MHSFHYICRSKYTLEIKSLMSIQATAVTETQLILFVSIIPFSSFSTNRIVQRDFQCQNALLHSRSIGVLSPNDLRSMHFYLTRVFEIFFGFVSVQVIFCIYKMSRC